MRLLADENIDQPIVDDLRKEGHQVDYVAEWSPGLKDEDVLAHASELRVLLLTADKDFGHLVFLKGQASAGVSLIRLAGLGPKQKTSLVTDAIRNHGKELLGRFSVLSPATLRIRRGL